MVGDGTYMTVGEAVAELAGLVSEDTVRRMADRGDFRSLRFGARQDRRSLAEDVRKYRDELQAQIASNNEGPDA